MKRDLPFKSPKTASIGMMENIDVNEGSDIQSMGLDEGSTK